ncbi:unnamed protein product [Phytophthora fragariaefolia]|uniref:Unnamed protein product n=1 Tax=Phytophthora fragariaefolia TaxID=1490495 RepID=A0A9W6U5E9_9STRA|nr:unnamed protein product [Phytophthora fragariaefolia]
MTLSGIVSLWSFAFRTSTTPLILNPVAALDGYKEVVDPPVALEPLSNLGWVEYVRWMARVEFLSSFQCRYGKRKSKSQKKREKRLKQQQQWS